MSREGIIDRILSDAEAEGEEIVRAAESRAEGIVRAAEEEAERERAEAEAEASARAKRISDGKAATARLDSSKVLLAEKRRVLDGVYVRALAALLCLGERESVSLAERLLREHAEEGDEVVFAANFPFAEKVARLPVFAERHLVVSRDRPDLSGGFLLRGKDCDKDLTYGALLAADREESQASIALELFGKQ